MHGSLNEDEQQRRHDNSVHFREHATILHLLGLDHDNLAVVGGGRRIRLLGLQGGKVVTPIIA